VSYLVRIVEDKYAFPGGGFQRPPLFFLHPALHLSHVEGLSNVLSERMVSLDYFQFWRADLKQRQIELPSNHFINRSVHNVPDSSACVTFDDEKRGREKSR